MVSDQDIPDPTPKRSCPAGKGAAMAKNADVNPAEVSEIVTHVVAELKRRGLM